MTNSVAGIANANTNRSPAPTKKSAYLTDKKHSKSIEHAQWHAELSRRMTAPLPHIVNIYNTWTHETIAIDTSKPHEISKHIANQFFRCHFTHAVTNLDPKLALKIVQAAKHFKANRVEIVSGFRSAKYNLILIKKGRQVARNSQHTLGNAVDFRIPDVPIRLLHRWARAQKLGGVGVYHGSGFIHMDTGPIRYWGGR